MGTNEKSKIEETKVQKCFSFDEEVWVLDEDYILDQIEDDEITDEDFVYIADAKFMLHKDYLNISYLIENMQDSAYEDFEDCGDYLGEFIENKNKSKKYDELQDLILTWLNKNIKQPNWYKPKMLKKITIKEFKNLYS
jgi:hypothetical protein